MNILICDTNTSDTQNLLTILEYSYGPAMKTTVLRRASDAIAHVRSGADVDICFFETVVPELNGIELARNLRTGGYNGEIAFLTESERYGPEAFEVEAISYLLKPVMPEQIRKIVSMAEHKRKASRVPDLTSGSAAVYNKPKTVPRCWLSHLKRIQLYLQEIV